MVRLRTNTIQSHEATLSSLSVLESLIASSQSKLDQLLPPPSILPTSSQEQASLELEIPSQTQGVDDLLIYPSSAEGDDEGIGAQAPKVEDETLDILGLVKVGKLERNQELWVVGVLGAVGGVGISLLAGLFSK